MGGDVWAKSGGGVVMALSAPHEIILQQLSWGSGFKVHSDGMFWYVGHLKIIAASLLNHVFNIFACDECDHGLGTLPKCISVHPAVKWVHKAVRGG